MRLVVGRIGRAQGVRGEVTVEVRTDEPELRFAVGQQLFAVDPSGMPSSAASILQSAGHRWQSGRLILALTGVEDRTAAEALRGTLLEADVDVLAPGEPDEYHDQALLGLEVRDGAGVTIGRVVDMLHLPAQDLLSVAVGDSVEPVLIPFVTALVPEVDLAGGYLVAELPEGLLPGSEGEATS